MCPGGRVASSTSAAAFARLRFAAARSAALSFFCLRFRGASAAAAAGSAAEADVVVLGVLAVLLVLGVLGVGCAGRSSEVAAAAASARSKRSQACGTAFLRRSCSLPGATSRTLHASGATAYARRSERAYETPPASAILTRASSEVTSSSACSRAAREECARSTTTWLCVCHQACDTSAAPRPPPPGAVDPLAVLAVAGAFDFAFAAAAASFSDDGAVARAVGAGGSLVTAGTPSSMTRAEPSRLSLTLYSP